MGEEEVAFRRPKSQSTLVWERRPTRFVYVRTIKVPAGSGHRMLDICIYIYIYMLYIC